MISFHIRNLQHELSKRFIRFNSVVEDSILSINRYFGKLSINEYISPDFYVGSWGDIFCYFNKERYVFFAKTVPDIYVVSNESFSETWISHNDELKPLEVAQIFDILYNIFRIRILLCRGLSIHAATIQFANKTISFSGSSGYGKSTQARLWIDYLGAFPLNFDKAAVFLSPENDVKICGVPWSGKEGLALQFEKYLDALIFIDKGPHNTIRRLSKSEAYAYLYTYCFVYPINSRIVNAYEAEIERYSSCVNAYHLTCTKDEEAVVTTFCELFGNAKYNDYKCKGLKMKIKEGYMLKKVADEWIIIPRGETALNATQTFLVSETGAFIWQKVEIGMNIQQIAAFICQEFNVNRATALRDVDSFCSLLKEKQLIYE